MPAAPTAAVAQGLGAGSAGPDTVSTRDSPPACARTDSVALIRTIKLMLSATIPRSVWFFAVEYNAETILGKRARPTTTHPRAEPSRTGLHVLIGTSTAARGG